jgi:hypothetical protein
MDRSDGRPTFHEWPCPNDEWLNDRTHHAKQNALVLRVRCVCRCGPLQPRDSLQQIRPGIQVGGHVAGLAAGVLPDAADDCRPAAVGSTRRFHGISILNTYATHAIPVAKRNSAISSTSTNGCFGATNGWCA